MKRKLAFLAMRILNRYCFAKWHMPDCKRCALYNYPEQSIRNLGGYCILTVWVHKLGVIAMGGKKNDETMVS